jgi:hypothetical protein
MHPEFYTEVSARSRSAAPLCASTSSAFRQPNPTQIIFKSVFRQRLIFSLEGFANSVELMQKALQGLVEPGAVTRTQRTVTRVPSTGVGPSLPVAEKPRTANASSNCSRAEVTRPSERLRMTSQPETCVHVLANI